MFARIGSRHFAHLYMSGLLRLRFRLRRGLRDLPLERRGHDRPVGAAREDVAASAARPDPARSPADRYRRASAMRSSSRLGSTSRRSLIFAVVTLTGQCSTGSGKSSPRPWAFAGAIVEERAATAP